MIASFRSRALKRFFEKNDASKINPAWVERIGMLLDALDDAEAPGDLDAVGVGFHALKGKPPRWSVTVSRNWRLTFGWEDKDAIDVDLEDYHGK
jgi:toxin HigB-1